ncbi:hypothetical protein OE88DRAFT_430304 [Heliocybe sulcata]|uniref:Uncharacterized protein n=1 Tax=Heliocybe sulcata TaxID=5364 RepID=A0A5C3MX69_9AGAM|nr:hypothetical protein OE88DRAFT_430304 [Heliocybe sulcata]
MQLLLTDNALEVVRDTSEANAEDRRVASLTSCAVTAVDTATSTQDDRVLCVHWFLSWRYRLTDQTFTLVRDTSTKDQWITVAHEEVFSSADVTPALMPGCDQSSEAIRPMTPTSGTNAVLDYPPSFAPAITPEAPQPVLAKKKSLMPWKKTQVTVILIGETGVGKTAFLSLLYNVCAGVPLEAWAPVHLEANEAGGSKSGSQTLGPMMYTIPCENGSSLRILDTPGLADTRGVEKDEEHKAAIAEYIKDHTETIDAVIILANGTNARLGVATQYTLTMISGMFPHSLVDNIGFVFTMVANIFSFNFESLSLPPELRNARHWKMDNPLAQWLKYQDAQRQDPPVDEEDLAEMHDTVFKGYRKTFALLNDLFIWLDDRRVQPTKEINELYEMTMNIESSISNVVSRIGQTEARRTELIALQARIAEQNQIKSINAKYQEIISRADWEHESTEKHNTLCVVGGCYSNCHLECQLDFTLERHELVGCAAFQMQDVCWICSHKVLDHQHYRSQWVQRMRQEEITDEAAKARFEGAETQSQELEVVKKYMEKTIHSYEEAIRNDQEQLGALCVRYSQLALSGSFAGVIDSTIRVLKTRLEDMKREGQSNGAQERMIRNITVLEKKLQVITEAEKKRGASESIVNRVGGVAQSVVKGVFRV